MQACGSVARKARRLRSRPTHYATRTTIREPKAEILAELAANDSNDARTDISVRVRECSGTHGSVSVGQTGSAGSTTGVANVAGRSGNANGLFITTRDVP